MLLTHIATLFIDPYRTPVHVIKLRERNIRPSIDFTHKIIFPL